MAALVVDNEGNDARTRAENDELRARVNNLQATLNSKFPDDVVSGFDQFEREVRQYHASTIDEDTMSGVILGALAKEAPTRRMRLCQPSRSQCLPPRFLQQDIGGNPRSVPRST